MNNLIKGYDKIKEYCRIHNIKLKQYQEDNFNIFYFFEILDCGVIFIIRVLKSNNKVYEKIETNSYNDISIINNIKELMEIIKNEKEQTKK